MPTTNGNRKILDLKRWEMVAPLQAATSAGAFIASSRHYRQQQLYVASNTSAWLYNPSEDGWTPLASPALAGTFGAGACGVAGAVSIGSSTGAAQLTATGGTTTTIQTNQNLQRDLRGYSVHITGGPNAGATLAIVSNTLGASATITVAAQATAFSASTTYRLITPVWYVLGAGTTAAGSFRKYDFATNTWTTLAQAGLPATISTDSKLVSTPSWIGENFLQFLTGTASAGAAATLTHTGKSWTTNQWTNYQIRIVSGTGAGQIRNIASNTGSVITVSANWTTNPDATSTYSIEGNDDFIYLMGNNAVTLYRYSITSNTWSTLTPTVARGGAPGAGMSGNWARASTDAAWTNESAIINGRRIYSFRGAAGAVADYYDIPSNSWTNDIPYAPKVETFTTGTKWVYNGDYLYAQKDVTGRWFRFNLVTSEMDGLTFMPMVQGAALVGDTAYDVTYTDGTTKIVYLCMAGNTTNLHARMMVF
jgi:hypothetical protein